MSENIKSEVISRRRALSLLGLAAALSLAVPPDGDDRNGCRGPRWQSSLSRERCWRELA